MKNSNNKQLSSLRSHCLLVGCSELMYACQQGNVASVARILKEEPIAVYKLDRARRTALHYCREQDVAGYLFMAAPELLDSPDRDGLTPLHLAVIQGNLPLVTALLANHADVNALDNEKHSVVHWATVCGELEALRLLLSHDADPSFADIHGGYPLHYAAQLCGAEGHMIFGVTALDKKPSTTSKLSLQVLNELLTHPRTSVHVSDREGRQPLLWAASAGSSRAVAALVKAGARVEACDKDGLTALHCAASRGHTECIETLLTLCGATTDIIDSNGCTALHYAVTLGHADSTSLLLDHDADPNRQDRKGRTPAHCGCAKGQLETMKILGSRNANLWMRNAKGDLPLHEAVISGRRELVTWLLQQRASAVNASGHDGKTPLHVAASQDHADICKILLDMGANVNPLYRTSRSTLVTPLDCALHRGHRSTAKFLQMHGGVTALKLQEAGSKNPLQMKDSRPSSRNVSSAYKQKEIKTIDLDQFRLVDTPHTTKKINRKSYSRLQNYCSSSSDNASPERPELCNCTHRCHHGKKLLEMLRKNKKYKRTNEKIERKNSYSDTDIRKSRTLEERRPRTSLEIQSHLRDVTDSEESDNKKLKKHRIKESKQSGKHHKYDYCDESSDNSSDRIRKPTQKRSKSDTRHRKYSDVSEYSENETKVTKKRSKSVSKIPKSATSIKKSKKGVKLNKYSDESDNLSDGSREIIEESDHKSSKRSKKLTRQYSSVEDIDFVDKLKGKSKKSGKKSSEKSDTKKSDSKKPSRSQSRSVRRSRMERVSEDEEDEKEKFKKKVVESDEDDDEQHHDKRTSKKKKYKDESDEDYDEQKKSKKKDKMEVKHKDESDQEEEDIESRASSRRSVKGRRKSVVIIEKSPDESEEEVETQIVEKTSKKSAKEIGKESKKEKKIKQISVDEQDAEVDDDEGGKKESRKQKSVKTEKLDAKNVKASDKSKESESCAPSAVSDTSIKSDKAKKSRRRSSEIEEKAVKKVIEKQLNNEVHETNVDKNLKSGENELVVENGEVTKVKKRLKQPNTSSESELDENLTGKSKRSSGKQITTKVDVHTSQEDILQSDSNDKNEVMEDGNGIIDGEDDEVKKKVDEKQDMDTEKAAKNVEKQEQILHEDKTVDNEIEVHANDEGEATAHDGKEMNNASCENLKEFEKLEAEIEKSIVVDKVVQQEETVDEKLDDRTMNDTTNTLEEHAAVKNDQSVPLSASVSPRSEESFKVLDNEELKTENDELKVQDAVLTNADERLEDRESKEVDKDVKEAKEEESKNEEMLSDNFYSSDEETTDRSSEEEEEENKLRDTLEVQTVLTDKDKETELDTGGGDDKNISYSTRDANLSPSSVARRKKLRKRSRIKPRMRASDISERGYESSNIIDSGFEPSPRVMTKNRLNNIKGANNKMVSMKSEEDDERDVRAKDRKPGDKHAVNMTTVNQSMQANIRRYYTERIIFQHLLELKRLQIRSSRANEAVMVKRAVDAYHRSGHQMARYPHREFTYDRFEQHLYDSLKKLQRVGSSNYRAIAEQAFHEAEQHKGSVNPMFCTTKTHRCNHATHAYTGIPCAAYIPMMNHHTIPKPGFPKVSDSFLPRINTGRKSQSAGRKNAVSLELSHGNDKQLIALPSDKLDVNKRYYVTFTVRGSNPGSRKGSNTGSEGEADKKTPLLQKLK